MKDKAEYALGHDPLGRRSFLKIGAAGFVGLALADFLRRRAHGQTAPAAPATRPVGGKAKAVIQLWMGGGPCHLDTWDPKPGAGEDYCGPYKKPLNTNVPGIQVCETMPLMAKLADKYAILRGMTHPSNGHETATYIMQTGTLPSGELVYPTMGAVVAFKKADESAVLPPYMMVTQPIGRITEAGFLGNRYTPFATGGDPNSKDFRVGGLLPPPGMKPEHMTERRELLKAIDTLGRKGDPDPQLALLDSYQDKAYSLILGNARKAFDLSQEKDELRDKYGRTTFGQSCLLARRLVENGVSFVTVNWGGWDTHSKHFEAMAKMLPVLDKGFAALLEDLSQRGLLDSTIVVWFGEFGRTPKIDLQPPWQGGRGHYCTAFSAVVAGGGFKGGKVVGVTDRLGEKVIERPVYPWDLSGSMYQLLGIDPNGRLPHPHGCVASVTPAASGKVASGGLLTEIM